MKNKRFIFIVGLISVSLIAGLFVYINFFFSRYIKETVLGNNFEITADDKEIDIKNLVKIEREINYIAILLEPAYKTVTDKEAKGIKTPNGEVINPEIKIVDENGKEYSLTYSGSRHFENNE